MSCPIFPIAEERPRRASPGERRPRGSAERSLDWHTGADRHRRVALDRSARSRPNEPDTLLRLKRKRCARGGDRIKRRGTRSEELQGRVEHHRHVLRRRAVFGPHPVYPIQETYHARWNIRSEPSPIYNRCNDRELSIGAALNTVCRRPRRRFQFNRRPVRHQQEIENSTVHRNANGPSASAGFGLAIRKTTGLARTMLAASGRAREVARRSRC